MRPEAGKSTSGEREAIVLPWAGRHPTLQPHRGDIQTSPEKLGGFTMRHRKRPTEPGTDVPASKPSPPSIPLGELSPSAGVALL